MMLLSKNKTERAKILGENIERYRKQQGLSRKELGDKVNVSEKTISAYAVGSAAPKLETIFELANVFEISVVKLLGESEVRCEYDFATKMLAAAHGKLTKVDDGYEVEIPVAIQHLGNNQGRTGRFVVTKIADKNELIDFFESILLPTLKKDVTFTWELEDYVTRQRPTM